MWSAPPTLGIGITITTSTAAAAAICRGTTGMGTWGGTTTTGTPARPCPGSGVSCPNSPQLKRSTYLLSANLPTFDNDRNVLRGDEDDIASLRGGGTWRLKSNNNVRLAFACAEEFFLERHRLADAVSTG